MNVQCTKAFTAALNKYLKAAGRPERAYYKEYTEREYRMQVDCMSDPGADYKPERGTIAAIMIYYPAEFYAVPRALSTRELNRIFRSSDKTADGLFAAILDEIEI